MPALRFPRVRLRPDPRVLVVRGLQLYRSAPEKVRLSVLLAVVVLLGPWIGGAYLAYLMWIMRLFGVELAPGP